MKAEAEKRTLDLLSAIGSIIGGSGRASYRKCRPPGIVAFLMLSALCSYRYAVSKSASAVVLSPSSKAIS